MSRVTEKFVIISELGFHLRPASVLAKTAKGFSSHIVAGKDGRTAEATSVIGLMTLEALPGDELEITADGEDAEEAIREIGALFASAFGERPS
jgi:phosphotransferase system HPr (HPr) family protein